MTHPYPPAPTGVDKAAWESAFSAARLHCGWHIAPQVSETVTVDGSGRFIQTLPTKYLVDLTSITNDGHAVARPDWSQMGLVEQRYNRWTARFRGVVAEMTHGYEELPKELEAVLTAVARGDFSGVTSQVTNGGHQVSFDLSRLVGHPRETLDHYQLGVVP